MVDRAVTPRWVMLFFEILPFTDKNTSLRPRHTKTLFFEVLPFTNDASVVYGKTSNKSMQKTVLTHQKSPRRFCMLSEKRGKTTRRCSVCLGLYADNTVQYTAIFHDCKIRNFQQKNALFFLFLLKIYIVGTR